MAKFKKVVNKMETKFDYENGIVEVREPLLEDEKMARRHASLAFKAGKEEPTQEEIMTCLIFRCCKFFDADNNEIKFKEVEIHRMKSSFLADCLQAIGSDSSVVNENIGEQ